MHPTIHHANWFAHNCNNTIAINYNLTKDSLVIDPGAFKGIWPEQIINLYDCKMILYEPVENADLRREKIRNSLLKIGWNLK